MNANDRLPAGAVGLLVLLSLLWGGNMVAIKVSVGEIPPMAAAAARSVVAGALTVLLMRLRGVPLFPDRAATFHGAVSGILFGLEFALLYLGLRHTLASRTSILLYTHPFFVAAGAHLFLAGDRLRANMAAGLVLAFTGVVLLFAGNWGKNSLDTLPGDLMILASAAGWAATTLYIKKYLTTRAVPLQVLFFQLFFSIPVLALLSLLFEAPPNPAALSAAAWTSFAYQAVIVAFLSYVAWFELIHRYRVSLLAAFTFFTPIFGVALSWLLLPGETFRPALLVSLALVCAGMVLVNRPGGK